MNLAVIPARGGSKRIPRKNVKLFRGKPIIAYSIEAALASGCFDRVVISTDDEEIATVARECGAEVPFLRPSHLSDDHTGTLPVVRHAVQWLIALGEALTHACCIYPTAPFLDPGDLQRGRDILQEDADLDFVFSVTRYGFPIQRALRMSGDGRLSMFQPEHELCRSQDLPEAYHDAGQFYWGTTEAWVQKDLIYSSACRGVMLPSHRVQDIDNDEDWKQAELKFSMLKEVSDE